ncbi:metallophosphoesterase [Maribacter polysiphoniae]|uniref:3',5'-cyclic AMP phosphodiesterase CpdA n=1 Tax=Maribacter polysiphoniae TaxID=429344 RepID=A0A316E2I1_9FLAO|nr:metallophosphoesterase [Maribacter polysiphoniae]MBD1260997.1 metallophosphoesterase [Maribacter polysiphoniae]PWK23762.1 3',5'-cyclic AMP phosphodiesterase CpdA [Maribacter polysiphoniae]
MKNTIPITLFLFFTILQLAGQTSDKIAFGPYIQQMSTKDATICWSTLEGEMTITDIAGEKDTIREFKQHKIHLANLEPDTEYVYDVLNDGSDEGKGKLRTYPDKSIPFNFVAIGDTRSRNNVHKRIIEQVGQLNPRFIVNSGDLVANGLSMRDWESFFKINKDFMTNTPYYPVLGNHEKDSPYYYDFFDLPYNERYYYFTVGDALFVVLDSEGLRTTIPAFTSEGMEDTYWEESGIEYLKKQKEWLEQVLELNREAGFVFIFQHTPLYSVKKSRVEESKKVRAFWGDIFSRYGVQVFLNGHDHHYHHAYDKGVHFITSAGAGAPLYDIDAVQPETLNYKKIEHFINVEVEQDEAVLHVFDIEGNEFDTIKVERRTIK